MGTTTLGPGQETTVSIVTAMHRGMEGPHLFRITVPVGPDGGAEDMALLVRANFR